jgi:hypothetical protein
MSLTPGTPAISASPQVGTMDHETEPSAEDKSARFTSGSLARLTYTTLNKTDPDRAWDELMEMIERKPPSERPERS